MVKVITYGTYDLLHYGHIRLLERAKSLGDYLIVGVTSDDFDKARGKINVQQSLMERIEAIRATGLANEIIIEEYEGQKLDDIRKYNVDIFTVGSDWKGKFDYLNEYCEVIYLERTEGVSSSEIRSEKRNIRLGLIGEVDLLYKVYTESKFVNGIDVVAAYTKNNKIVESKLEVLNSLEELLDVCDAVYIASHPESHYKIILSCLNKNKHVLCETPTTLNKKENEELILLAKKNSCILMDFLKTAYAPAYNRLLALMKSGKIGKIISVDAVCTSMIDIQDSLWNSMYYWGPTALLPIFNLLGTEYNYKMVVSKICDNKPIFTKIDFIYDEAVASIKVGNGVKSEGELIISGTKGYAYVPAPWWKTDYFEIRYEEQSNNKRYFYQLDGEGIRYQLVAFVKMIETGSNLSYIDEDISNAICTIMQDFNNGINLKVI